MHLLIPFASVLSEAGRHALGTLALPQLDALLALVGPAARDEGDEYDFSPPHERALARAIGLEGGDGCRPWAARHAHEDGLDPGDEAWGELTPVHWHVGAEQVSLGHPSRLGLEADESRELMDAVRPLFEDDGWPLVWGAPMRWYVRHDSLADLPTASIDRVVGRSVDLWLRAGAAGGTDARLSRLRRLQNEVQMLLFTHPLNARREDRGALPVNSFWLSGCGRFQPGRPAPALVVDDRLREPALGEDWAAWAEAWRALDAGPVAAALAAVRAGRPLRLELCGERHAQAFEPVAHGWWSRLRATWQPPAPAARWLEAL